LFPCWDLAFADFLYSARRFGIFFFLPLGCRSFFPRPPGTKSYRVFPPLFLAPSLSRWHPHHLRSLPTSYHFSQETFCVSGLFFSFYLSSPPFNSLRVCVGSPSFTACSFRTVFSLLSDPAPSYLFAARVFSALGQALGPWFFAPNFFVLCAQVLGFCLQ